MNREKIILESLLSVNTYKKTMEKYNERNGSKSSASFIKEMFYRNVRNLFRQVSQDEIVKIEMVGILNYCRMNDQKIIQLYDIEKEVKIEVDMMYKNKMKEACFKLLG